MKLNKFQQALVVKYLRLAMKLAREYEDIRADISFDDLCSEAYYRLCLAAIKFNPNNVGYQGRSASFCTYAANGIRMGLRSLILRHTTSLQYTRVISMDRPQDIEYREVSFENKWKQLIEGLSESEKVLITLRFQKGYSYKQIKNNLGISRHIAQAKIKYILEKCRRQLS